MSDTRDPRATRRHGGHDWALVLAAGEGSRLRTLTTTASGIAIPKQFCSLHGGESLLHEALRRAWTVVPAKRTCVVVAAHHRHWWHGLPLHMPPENVIVQPRNRGTAHGILLPLLHIVQRDPDARLLVLPADHYVSSEPILTASLRLAMATVRADREHLLLLGITPDDADPELGYIVAEKRDGGGIDAVREFVEKPPASEARKLIARRGLWNSFIFAAHAGTLLRSLEARCGAAITGIHHILATAGDDHEREGRLAALYERLPVVDFSRDILQASPGELRVLTVPACGWSDLGTPRRVIDILRRGASQGRRPGPVPVGTIAAPLDLADPLRCARETSSSRASSLRS